MQARRPLITRYRIFWILMIILFGIFVYWLLLVHPDSDVDEEFVLKSYAIDDKPKERQQLAERVENVEVDVEGFEFSLSSFSGELIMRLWADQAVKGLGSYSLGEGTVLFSLPNGNSMLLRLKNCDFSHATDTVEITGTIIGQVLVNSEKDSEGTGQYFSAESLNWYLGSESVDAMRVIYRGPTIEVTGDAMSVDLQSGRIEFTGPVHAGV